MHEYVKTDGDIIGLDAILFQNSTKISKTSPVRLFVTVNNTEGIRAAGRKQKVVSSHRVLNDPEHNIAPVGIKGMTGSKKNRFGVIQRSAGGKVFRFFVQVKTDKV
jgi:hypothetical protein